MRGLWRRHPHLVAFGAYLALSAAVTWPLLPRMASALVGEGTGPWRTLWGFWRLSEGIGRDAPLLCDALRPGGGASPWLEPLDLPAALAALPLWPLTPALPEVAIYNAALFATFPLAGFAAYLLCRELWGDHLAPFLAGALYTASSYHLSSALGQLHLASMEWSPLYFLGLLRLVRRRGAGSPLLAGGALALAGAASAWNLVLCGVGTVVLLVAWLRSDPYLLDRSCLRRAALALATFALLAGWLHAGQLRAYLSEPLAAPPDPARGSADLLSFLVPGATSAWHRAADGWRRLTSSEAGTGAYVGYVALGLAVLAGARARASRSWLGMALVGFALALGTRLQVNGRVLSELPLPYAWLERALPPLRLDGAPARFCWLVAFGVSVAAGAGLAQLVRSGRRGPLVACALTALALVEGWPSAMATTAWPAPRFLRDLARDGERWAVLDGTAPGRRLWHQLLHRHPLVGCPAERAPDSLERLLAGAPALRALLGDGGGVAGREESVRELQRLGVRLLIVDGRRLVAARALRLPLAYEGEGIAVYEVPAPELSRSVPSPREALPAREAVATAF